MEFARNNVCNWSDDIQTECIINETRTLSLFDYFSLKKYSMYFFFIILLQHSQLIALSKFQNLKILAEHNNNNE